MFSLVVTGADLLILINIIYLTPIKKQLVLCMSMLYCYIVRVSKLIVINTTILYCKSNIFINKKYCNIIFLISFQTP